MIEFKEIPGWELRNFDKFIDENNIVILFSPLSKEDLGLDFDLMNIIPPKRKIFWNFFTYQNFNKGAFNFFQPFITEETREKINEYSALYWDNQSLSWLSNRAMMKYFGDYFLVPEVGEAGLLSAVVPRGGIEHFLEYFRQLDEYFGDSACIAFGDDPDVQLVQNIENFFLRCEGELPMKVSDADRILFLSRHSHTGLPGKEKIMANRDYCRKLMEWFISNMPAHKLETIKSWINSPAWSDPAKASTRNQMRMWIDTYLSKYPAIQTNPYETFL